MPPSDRSDAVTFGKRIASARKQLGLGLRDLAIKIPKDDGQPISLQYFDDIEHDRRRADTAQLIEQFAAGLQIKLELPYFDAGKLSSDALSSGANEGKIVAAYQAFRKVIRGKP